MVGTSTLTNMQLRLSETGGPSGRRGQSEARGVDRSMGAGDSLAGRSETFKHALPTSEGLSLVIGRPVRSLLLLHFEQCNSGQDKQGLHLLVTKGGCMSTQF